MTLPERFKERTAALLGTDEAQRLFSAIESGGAVKAFRVNGIKTSLEDFEAARPRIERERIAFPPNAYITREEYPGSLPEHHSGAIYMQDASAMSTVYATDIPRGARVLDSCSAPGGKTTQLAELVGEEGLIVANEYERRRAFILRQNIERLGCSRAVICNLDTAELAELYPCEFDLVLCDAPCSGEGMFRKNERAIEEWSEENVLVCAERQREILSNVAKCVRGGGRLIYSTCTFSAEENEENVKWFLDTHSDFSLCEVKEELKESTSDGIAIADCEYDMTLCRRIYPHNSMGEGQFIALFEKKVGSEEKKNRKNEKKSDKRSNTDGKKGKNGASDDAIRAAREFLAENLLSMPKGELLTVGENVFLCPSVRLPEHGVISAGVCVGEWRKGRMIPHHHLFTAFGRDLRLKVSLSGESAECAAYLRGEEIATEHDGAVSGYCAVLIDGCAVGGGKIVGGRCKNYYPKGLRE